MRSEPIDPIDFCADGIIDNAQALIKQGVSERDAYRFAIRHAIQAADLVRSARRHRSDQMFRNISDVFQGATDNEDVKQ